MKSREKPRFHVGGNRAKCSYLLPYIEQDNIHRLYRYDKQWYAAENYTAVGQQAPLFYCPSNRTGGVIDLAPFIRQWGSPMPPVVGASDYVLCKGANAGLDADPTRIPAAAVNNPSQPATEPFIDGPVVMDQAWGVASLGDTLHPWYAGILGVTAQYGLPPNPADEPMNRRPGTPSVIGSDGSGYNAKGLDKVSGFRSMHPGGCNFLFADGSAHYIPQSISPGVYRALSTYAGGEVVPGTDF